VHLGHKLISYQGYQFEVDFFADVIFCVSVLLCVLLLARGLKCTVCLVEFRGGENTTAMPCTHLFHPHCILPWLEKVHCIMAI